MPESKLALLIYSERSVSQGTEKRRERYNLDGDGGGGGANRDYPAHRVWTVLNTKLPVLSNNLLSFVLIKDLYIGQSVLLTVRNYGVATLS